ncbi:hypothetical protein SKAU_G00376880 [Synaphobranchus kaupii]|uniref:Uncharacterized protein n=1 Tax=Synaphobranchus kaupii TaxID=118154 RepID=A0A9Q1ECU7_SYNKA|nr:hypothetical protein SKAU_G00376880 [Synaphobranchus kaupii]
MVGWGRGLRQVARVEGETSGGRDQQRQRDQRQERPGAGETTSARRDQERGRPAAGETSIGETRLTT